MGAHDSGHCFDPCWVPWETPFATTICGLSATCTLVSPLFLQTRLYRQPFLRFHPPEQRKPPFIRWRCSITMKARATSSFTWNNMIKSPLSKSPGKPFLCGGGHWTYAFHTWRARSRLRGELEEVSLCDTRRLCCSVMSWESASAGSLAALMNRGS